jgi:hypothetical protein
MLVLDEADQLLEMGLKEEVRVRVLGGWGFMHLVNPKACQC